MNLHNYKPFDREEPLSTESWEIFCQEYLRLDLNREIPQMRARRIAAYRKAYPSAKDMYPADVNVKAIALLRKEEVAERLAFLYEQEGSGVENEFKWTKAKAEDELLNMVLSPDTKDGDRLKAISMLNEIRGVTKPEEKKETIIDTVQSFFEKIGVKD